MTSPSKELQRVFVLGDSRTGTTTIHKFLKAAGYRSIHFFYRESGVSEPAHVDYDNNWIRLKQFIDTTDFMAFSDYPVRVFYKELMRTYPDDLFVLTVRKDISTWQRSVTTFFEKFNIQINLSEWTQSHEFINADIGRLADDLGVALCEICIDDDTTENGHRLSEFLGLDGKYALGWENRTSAYDNSIWSARATLYHTSNSNVLDYVKRATHPSKAMLSEYGWAFLINDSSEFMDYSYGSKHWTDETVDKAVSTLRNRRAILREKDIIYLKFAIPEKCTVYPQYLPRIFEEREPSLNRPAVQISERGLDFFSYPVDLLRDARSFGNIYFRGDSHTNWLGSHVVYCHIVERMNAEFQNRSNMKTMKPIRLQDMSGELAGYSGDLFSQLDPETRKTYADVWTPFALGDNFEHLVRYSIKQAGRGAHRIPVEADLLNSLGERETFRFRNKNVDLPRAVVFRDSTLDFMVDLLAEHFSESLFIWHNGLVYRDIVEREKPDIVLHVMAERFLVQYERAEAFHVLGIASGA